MTIAMQTLRTWIPERIEPGTLFMLAQADPAAELSQANVSPFRAVLACPSCGTLAMMTRAQYEGREAMVCADARCSAEYTLNGDEIRYRRAQ